jgi:RNA polymerase sigma-70 factor (ECF subfamily)
MTEAERRAWVLAALDDYEVRLVRYSARLVGDEDLARDCVQHAFLKLCGESVLWGRRLACHESETPAPHRLAAWLFRVCRNRALDHLRQAGREKSLEDSYRRDEHEQQPASRMGDPADLADARELSACLRLFVERLPPAQREAIDLWCEGFAYKEIGEITGHKEGHVRVLVHRGLSRVREQPQVRAWLEECRPLTPSAARSGTDAIGQLPAVSPRMQKVLP